MLSSPALEREKIPRWYTIYNAGNKFIIQERNLSGKFSQKIQWNKRKLRALIWVDGSTVVSLYISLYYAALLCVLLDSCQGLYCFQGMPIMYNLIGKTVGLQKKL